MTFNPPTQLVWFKKDLRTKDHRPLHEAQKRGDILGLFIIEDAWLESAEFSARHYQFALDSLLELKGQLTKLNIPLVIKQGDAVAVFNTLRKECPFDHIFSHQETGSHWTYQRDLAVKAWCQDQKVQWHEYQQFAVHRGLKNRNVWNQKRKKVIERALWPRVTGQNINKLAMTNTPLPHFSLEKNQDPTPGGSKEAHQLIESFLSERGKYYQKEMSSPVTAYDSCSRLSPHIAWGTISITEIQQKLSEARRELKLMPQEATPWLRSLRSFESRLWWHCHFIQKLESEPEIEFENVNRGFDGMRENDFNEEFFEAWKKGQTGLPFIDACMRALNQHGWINFRMRAMLISFASYQLWLHWKKTATHLAQLFVDFEPGIHFSQIQMQSGVTGINAIRVYSPIKQGKDQDPNGEFIKRYCPELEGLEAPDLHDPSGVPPLLRNTSLLPSYPTPIIDHKEKYNEAKKKIFQWRNKPEVKKRARAVYTKHGSRKNTFFPNQNRNKAFGNWNDTKGERP